MPRRSTRSRPYERRRRTRRRRQQKGGSNENIDQQALVTWFQTAEKIHTVAPPLAIEDVKRPELTLSLGGGPALKNYNPPYLGDIVTNIAVGLGQGTQIMTYPQFAAAMSFLRDKDKDFFDFLTILENDLRKFYQISVIGDITEIISPPNLAEPAPIRTPIIWIAYANLPLGGTEPRVPVLGNIKALSTSTAVTANPAAPSQQAQ